MSFKVVKNQAGAVVAFGPNDENYEPAIAAGNTLTIEVVQPVITPPVPTYRELRAPLYPPVKDGLDAIAKGGQALEDWKAACMAVKALIPKV